MNMQTSVKTCFKKFITLKGRASRSEFWWFALFVMVTGYALKLFIDIPIFGYEFLSPVAPISGLSSIITFLPWICVIIRRFHDVNVSGWWILSFYVLVIVFSLFITVIIATSIFSYIDSLVILAVIVIISIASLIIIIVGPITGLVFLCKKGTAGDNRFGADPLAEENPH